MNTERTGLEAHLAIQGVGRFFSAAFLTVWLAGWVVGETFALWFLSVGAYALTTGELSGAGSKPISPGVVMFAGLFLLVWLTLWTIGGLAAGRELLRLLFGRDRILAHHDGLEVEHRCGFLRSVQRVPRAEIRRFHRKPGSAALCVETTGGIIEVTRLGNQAARAELETALNAEFHVTAPPRPIGALPKGWCETMSPERDAVLVKDPVVRRQQARVMWIICGLLSIIPLYLLSAARERPELWGAVLFFLALTAAACWGAVWLRFGRSEWRLAPGRLLLQRRFGGNLKPRFEAVALELSEDNSGDGGPTYALMAIAVGAPARPTHNYHTGKHRHTIHSQSDDPTGPRNLGLWLNQRCQLPFADLTTAESKALELAALKEQLAGSGRLGRVALRVIERLAPSPRRPND